MPTHSSEGFIYLMEKLIVEEQIIVNISPQKVAELFCKKDYERDWRTLKSGGLTMTAKQIRTITEKIAELFEQIDELKSYIEQLTNGVMAKLGSNETNRLAIQDYNRRIINLEAELQSLWKTT